MAVVELHAEHRVRQGLKHDTLDFYSFFFRHFVNISGPRSLIYIVRSKCADSFLSFVTAVQPSSKISTPYVPALTIGSIARTMPPFSLGPVPGTPKFGICGSSCILVPMPCPTNSRTTEKPFDSTYR